MTKRESDERRARIYRAKYGGSKASARVLGFDALVRLLRATRADERRRLRETGFFR